MSFLVRLSCLVLSLALASMLASGSHGPTGVLAPSQEDETSAPSKQNERLMKLAGKYATMTRFTAPDGTASPETTGEATFSSILGGRFLLQEEKGTMFGQGFESRKMYGFNTAAKKYEGVWVYTGSTSMMTMQGTSPDDGKTITYSASYEGTAGAASKLDIVITETSADKFTITLRSKPDGGAKAAVMETTYTRKR